MGRKRALLNATQEVALTAVDRAHKKLVEVKAVGELELRRALDAKIAEAEAEEYVAVRRAVELGISKAHVGEEGLNTKNPDAANRVLRRHGDEVGVTRAPVNRAPVEPFAWADDAHTEIKIVYPFFATSSKDPEYPEILAGLVRENRAGGWDVVEDDTDQVTEFGTLPGSLHWELESVPADQRGSMASLLTAWAEGNR